MLPFWEMMEKDDLLTEQPVKTYHLCAIVSDQNPLAQQATISLRQLADYNICTPARGMNARRMFGCPHTCSCLVMMNESSMDIARTPKITIRLMEVGTSI